MSLDEALEEKIAPLRADIETLKAQVAGNGGLIQGLAHDLARLGLEVEALKGNPPADDGPADDDPPVVDPPTDDDPPVSNTDLSINLNFERYTNCLVPDESSPTGYRITDPRFVALYGQYDTIRAMDWQNLLSAKHRNTTWSNRVTAGDFDPGSTRGRWRSTGVPLEAIIEVANACNGHIWLCLYQQSDVDYWVEAGKLFNRLLKPGLHAYLEGANEWWDSRRGWHYNDLSGGDFAKTAQLYAEDCAAKFGAFNKHFPADRTTRILGGQLHSIGALKSHALKHIDPADFDAIACSGYFGNSQHEGHHWKTGKHGLEESLRFLEDHAELAASINKKLCIYELSQHIMDNLWLATSRSVVEGIGTMIAKAQDLGASPICLEIGAGRIYANSPWALYDTEYQRRETAIGLNLPKI